MKINLPLSVRATASGDPDPGEPAVPAPVGAAVPAPVAAPLPAPPVIGQVLPMSGDGSSASGETPAPYLYQYSPGRRVQQGAPQGAVQLP
jgi:hypothetical protein